MRTALPTATAEKLARVILLATLIASAPGLVPVPLADMIWVPLTVMPLTVVVTAAGNPLFTVAVAPEVETTGDVGDTAGPVMVTTAPEELAS